VPALKAGLADPERPELVRLAVTRVLGEIPHQDAVDALLAALPEATPTVRRAAVRALARLRTSYPDLRFPKELVFAAILREAKVYYADRQAEALLGEAQAETAEESLLSRALRERQARTMDVVFSLMGLRYHPRDMANAYQGLLSDKRAVRASALEFLDNLLKKRIREVLLPIVEPRALPELQTQARVLFGATVETRYDALIGLLEGDDPWLKACTLCALRAEERRQLEPLVRKAQEDRHPVVQEAASRAAAA